jgi:hypothetical protein
MSEPWLTKREVAAKLRVSPRTVERLRLPVHCRVGGQNRYLFSEVEAHFAGDQGRPAEIVELRRA